jgi:thymidylate synthase (FAD)
MSVKLIWITPEAEKVISYCARVSNPSNQENYDTAPRLLKYCAKNKHWSVFEQASMCVEVETTRAISAQILRHKLQAQEFSQRYASVDNTSIEIPHLRRQDTKNRQSSIDDIPDINEAFRERIEKHFFESFQLYNDLLEQGVAKESARFVLPLSTKTRLYLSGNIRNWIHYCQARCHESTQKEHRDIAMQVREILLEQLPSLCEILDLETKV